MEGTEAELITRPAGATACQMAFWPFLKPDTCPVVSVIVPPGQFACMVKAYEDDE